MAAPVEAVPNVPTAPATAVEVNHPAAAPKATPEPIEPPSTVGAKVRPCGDDGNTPAVAADAESARSADAD